jgi:hypothetical protein
VIFIPSFEKGHKGNRIDTEIQAGFQLFGRISLGKYALGIRLSDILPDP